MCASGVESKEDITIACDRLPDGTKDDVSAREPSNGASVVLFPSLAGSVLECLESPVEGFQGARIWMGLSTLLGLGGGRESVELQLTDKTRTATSNPFV